MAIFPPIHLHRHLPGPRWLGGTVVLGIAAGLLCGSILLLALNLAELRAGFASVDHSNATLRQIGSVRVNLLRAESSASEFVLTDDPTHREIRRKASETARDSAQALTVLVAANPPQARRARLLQTLIEARLAALEASASKHSSSIRAVRATIRRNRNVQLTDAIANTIDVLRREELRSLADGQANADRQTTRAMLVAIVTGALSILAGVLGFGIFQRQRHGTEMRESRDEVAHLQRLDTMGMTAAALAHEIAQPLGAASNYLAALHRQVVAMAGSTRLLETLQKAAAQVQRAGAVIQRLRNFIEKRGTTRSVEMLATIGSDAVALLGTLSGSVVLKMDIAANLPNVMVDRIQIQQVLVNLMRNAIEAMDGCPRQELCLSMTSVPQDLVQISIADTGPGLAKELSGGLFTAFVSTKKRGMGVGLSICRDIVKSHGGHIWTEPNPGGGTVFRFTLPALRAQPMAKAA